MGCRIYFKISFGRYNKNIGGITMEIDYKLIGKRIREERISQNLSQQTLAEISNISPTNISHIERGATKLSLPTLISIANALAVSADFLLCDSLVEAERIYIDEINCLLLDCNPNELKLIIDIMKSIKTSLRRYNKVTKS